MLPTLLLLLLLLLVLLLLELLLLPHPVQPSHEVIKLLACDDAVAIRVHHVERDATTCSRVTG